MQYIVSINQVKALSWGLNAQQAMLFAFLYQVPSWADSRQIDGHTFFNVSKGKIVEELPLLTDKPDTAYRLMKQLAQAGLIVMTSCDNRTYMRLTPKARAWNRTGSEKSPTLGQEGGGSENFPTSEKNPRGVGKISEPGSEKSPTNQDTNDQVTKDQNPSHSGAGDLFARAGSLTDDGQALDDTPEPRPPLAGHAERQHPMTLDWQPDPSTWERACHDRGLPADIEAPRSLLDFREHFAARPGRTATHADWTRRFARWVHEDYCRQTAGGHADDRATADRPRHVRAEREAIREQLANPQDLSWADGWWPDAAGGAPGSGAGAGGPGIHPAGGDFSQDVQQCVPECGPADAGAPRAGAGAGDLAGVADAGGGRAGDERAQALGGYLAADDPGAGVDAGAAPQRRRAAGRG